MQEELKIKTEAYYAIQGIRIQAELRIKAFVREERLTEHESEALHFWLRDVLKRSEDQTKKDVAVLLKGIPIWEHWLKNVTGIGPCLAGSLYAGVQDIARFETVSKLWKYCGQDVVDGHAPKRKRGEKITWNPFLRMTVYKVTDSFLKQNPDKCLYRWLYDEHKAIYRSRYPEKADSGRRTKSGGIIWNYTDLHIHNMAKRKAGKIFLEHLWAEWRRLEGLSVTEPWIIKHGGHEHYVEPTQN